MAFPGALSMAFENIAPLIISPFTRRAAIRPWLRALAERVANYPMISVLLSVLSFAFLGPVAAVVIVATMLDHEFAHWYMMRKLGYSPGPVRLLPVIGAYVRAGRPMLRSADIALVYLAGPVAGILSAESVAFIASKALSVGLEQQVFVGAAVAIGLNLFNLLPYEPLDGGLICRALPYPALLVFPLALAGWLQHAGMLETRGGIVAFAVAATRGRAPRGPVAPVRRRPSQENGSGRCDWTSGMAGELQRSHGNPAPGCVGLRTDIGRWSGDVREHSQGGVLDDILTGR